MDRISMVPAASTDRRYHGHRPGLSAGPARVPPACVVRPAVPAFARLPRTGVASEPAAPRTRRGEQPALNEHWTITGIPRIEMPVTVQNSTIWTRRHSRRISPDTYAFDPDPVHCLKPLRGRPRPGPATAP